jgi:hypothetical protein
MPHRENPKLVYEIGEDQVDAAKVITTYVLSYVETGDKKSGKHSLALYYNDGSRQLRVAVDGKDFSPKSEEENKTKLTRDELTTAAKEVFKLFFKQF